MKYFIPLLIFLVIGGFFWKGLHQDPHRLSSTLIGKPIPEFIAPNLLNDPAVTAKQFLNHVSLLNVWASWCEACAAEHAELMDIAATKIVTIYGLNYKDDAMAAETWLQQYGNPYKAVLFDPEGKLAIDFGVYGTPETFLIDKKGIVRYKYVGAITAKVWQEEIKPKVRSLEK